MGRGAGIREASDAIREASDALLYNCHPYFM